MKDLTCKVFERNHSRLSLWLQGRERFIKHDPKAQNIKKKIDVFECIKFLTLQLAAIHK